MARARRRRRHAPRPADRAVGYIRASTDRQSLTAGAQSLALERFAEANDVTIANLRFDIGVSGATEPDRRPGLTAAIADLAALDCGVLLVAKRDRLARDIVIARQIQRLAEIEGATVVDLESAHLGRAAPLVQGMRDLFAEEERREISIRTRLALEPKRLAGLQTTAIPPYGFFYRRGRMVKRPTEQRTLLQIERWRTAGLSIRKIVDRLNADPKRYKPRGSRWHLTTVANIVRRIEAKAL